MTPKEIFIVEGVSRSIPYARAAAWEGLRQILGGEDEAQWALVVGQYNPAEVVADDSPLNPTLDDPPHMIPACRYHIEIARIEVEVEA